MSVISMGTLRGIIAAVLLGLFVWLVVWAWSKARRPVFDAAARLPLEDEPLPREEA